MTHTVPAQTRTTSSSQHIALTEQYSAHNYHPLPVVLSHGEGAWVTDVEGNRYLDCLAGYSALNFGHSHPELVAVAQEQLQRLTLTSRAFYNDQLGPFAADLCALAGKEMFLPMNTGAEAVETALKVARRWGAQVKGVDPARSTIITMEGNFHGRTTTIISFTTDDDAKRDFGPYTPGFATVPYGDLAALEAAITPDTVAVLVEPIQGESGVLIPPDGYLRGIRELASRHNVLMLADEVQSGLARTGKTFACDHEDVVPDIYILGKALGGGLLPVSGILADRDIMSVITPGSHGSTFGGNPLACAVGRAVVALLATGEPQAAATNLGVEFERILRGLPPEWVSAVRVRGLWAGLDVTPGHHTGRELCERLLENGVLAKDTHGSTIRLAPPLVCTTEDLAFLEQAVHRAVGK